MSKYVPMYTLVCIVCILWFLFVYTYICVYVEHIYSMW